MSSYRGTPWSYSIIGAILTFMIFTLILVYIMVSQNVEVLYPDYYERTLKYDEVQNRLAMGEKPEFKVIYHFSTNKDSIFFQFPSQSTADGTLAFIKPDNSKSDLKFPFSVESNQELGLSMATFIKGAWSVEAEWKSDTTHVLSRFKLIL
jgi:hypothetical protein